MGLGVGRFFGLRWSYPFYAAAAFSAVLTLALGQDNPTFETIALGAIALTAYAMAAVESRPDVLPVAFVLGALAVVSAANAFHLSAQWSILAFAALAWVYALARLGWRVLPWLRPSWKVWWSGVPSGQAIPGGWDNTRLAGVRLHQWDSVLAAAGAVVAGLFLPGAFAPHASATQGVALALLSLAALLALFSDETATRLPLYVAGALVAIAVSWEARYLGAANPQAFVLAPGSYQLLIGALLPVDRKMPAGQRMGQLASLSGALLLTVPTLIQMFAPDLAWLYALILTLEALVIAGIGVGTHSRQLVVVGSCFVGAAALRGAILAIQSGLPVPLVIGVFAVLLLGGATWLSLRARRAAERAA